MNQNTTRRIVVCDIDETVSVIGQRRLRLLADKVVDWKTFYEDDFDDEPKRDMCEAVRRLIRNGVKVVFSTSRCECCRDRTLSWLRSHIHPSIGDDILLMRPDRCDDSEAVQKVGKVLSHYGVEDIALVLDDNRSVLDAWTRRGVAVLDAGTLS